MMKILIFGGTTESGNLAQKLAENGMEITLVVATEYGEKIRTYSNNVHVLAKRFDEKEMARLLESHPFDAVVDATHPYAYIVTKNIKGACHETGIRYLRLLRDESTEFPFVTYVSGAQEAADLLDRETGNVLLAIGSKELNPFTKIKDFASRCYVRILPMPESLQKAIDLGFQHSHLFCMQGPFDERMNRAVLETSKAKFLVTKDSGEIGGFAAKIKAASHCGIHVIVIKRPVSETGLSYRELLHFFHVDISVSNNPPKKSFSFFPLFVDLREKTILVIGGGSVAQRRIGILHAFGASVILLSPSITPALQKMIDCGEIDYLNKKYDSNDIERFRPFLVIAATDDRKVNHAIAQDANRQGVFVIVSDCREECNCYFPAIAGNESFVAGIVSQDGNHQGVRMMAEQIRHIFNSADCQ